MSAFIVSDATINAIINHYRHDHRNSDLRGWPSVYRDEVAGLGGDELWSLLGIKLRAMNERAIVARYGEDSINFMSGGETPDEYIPYVYSNQMPRPLTQVYGALGCYLYQCSEGSVVDEELYKVLDREHDQMAHTLVRQLVERSGYSIPWGIE
jgi:hypothetical protein